MAKLVQRKAPNTLELDVAPPLLLDIRDRLNMLNVPLDFMVHDFFGLTKIPNKCYKSSIPVTIVG